MSTAIKMRDWRGPALLSFGFRPFFLLAGLWAAVAMAIWVSALSGHVLLPTAFDPISWHAHEFLFGYGAAVISGFLLTAVPNWTGRLPVVGWPLAGLVALWIAGRVAVAVSALLPAGLVVAADLAQGVVLALVLGREILAGRNWRNLPVLGLWALFLAANAAFHWQAAQGAAFDGGALRVGIAGVVMLIALIGGRIVPSFTRNWLAQRRAAQLPAAAGRFDRAVLGLTGVALAGFVLWPASRGVAALCALAGLGTLVRLARWQGYSTLAEPLVWVLHLAYALVGLGFFSVAAAVAGLWPLSGALHPWLAGAVGLMTLAVMTRASLGHTGRPLHAGPGIAACYLALLVSVLARFAAAFLPGVDWPLHLAAGAWIVAFLGFSAIYAPILMRPRVAAKRVSGARDPG